MVMLGGLVYDVTDPVHPRRLCVISNTSAHLWTGDTFAYLKAVSPSATSIVLHSIGSGNESVTGRIPYPNLDSGNPFAPAWWAVDGTVAATMIQPSQPVAGDRSRVWVYTPGFTGELTSFPYPLTDCICRFGIPPPVLAISADHQYLVAGWLNKGTAPLTVYRLSDRSPVKTFDAGFNMALWERSGHQLLVSGTGGSASWTPETGQVALAGAQTWSFLPGLSPDGAAVAYTAYLDSSDPMSLRVFAYDVKAGKTRMLRDALRSQVVFVKPGWVWYLEETVCDASDSTCPPWHTRPTNNVKAMDLADGVERQVNFQYAEDVASLVPGEFWPSS